MTIRKFIQLFHYTGDALHVSRPKTQLLDSLHLNSMEDKNPEDKLTRHVRSNMILCLLIDARILAIPLIYKLFYFSSS